MVTRHRRKGKRVGKKGSVIAQSAQKSSEVPFDLLDRLPPEVRDMIFGYMIQNILETELLRYTQMPSIFSKDLRRHLVTSPWITLNKKFCAEYLQMLLETIELGGDLASERSVLKDCLRNINQRLVISMAHINVGHPGEMLYPHIEGIYLYQATMMLDRLGGITKSRYEWINRFFTRPLKQLRRHHEEYDIPASKISICLNHGSPTTAIEAYLYTRHIAQSLGVVLNLRLPSVEARIWVSDYEKSVGAIDEELQKLRGELGECFRWLRSRCGHMVVWAHFHFLEAVLERDLVELRRLHMESIKEVTSFWKRHDGWYEVGDLFRLAKLWRLEAWKAERNRRAGERFLMGWCLN